MAPLKLLLLGIVLLLAPTSTESYASGAPGDNNQQVCTDLIPRHRDTTRQTTPAPYAITFSPRTYTPGGGNITVTMESRCGTPFQGFLLTTQYADPKLNQTSRPGTFGNPLPAGTRRTCSNDSVALIRAVTHTDPTNKTNLIFTWTPPAASAKGHIVFRATFLQIKTVYWVDVHSDLLVDSTLGQPSNTSGYITPGSTTVAPGCPATTAGPATTTKSGTGGTESLGARGGAQCLVVWLCVVTYILAIFH